jgi:hypothetical protein
MSAVNREANQQFADGTPHTVAAGRLLDLDGTGIILR